MCAPAFPALWRQHNSYWMVVGHIRLCVRPTFYFVLMGLCACMSHLIVCVFSFLPVSLLHLCVIRKVKALVRHTSLSSCLFAVLIILAIYIFTSFTFTSILNACFTCPSDALLYFLHLALGLNKVWSQKETAVLLMEKCLY